MSVANGVSLLGCVVLALLAWAIGGFRRPIPWRTVIGSAVLMLGMATLVFWVPPIRKVLVIVNAAVHSLLGASREGALFLFGPLALNRGEMTPSGESSVGFVLAAQVLPAVIFFASLMALLYHLRVMPVLVRWIGRLFHKGMGLSGAESLAGASNVFVGIESAAAVRPYLATMTRSELLTLLACGMSTVASTTLALYVFFLGEQFPQVAGHLLSASMLSIPAAAMMSKMMLPETDEPATRGHVPEIPQEERRQTAMAALIAGAWDGLKLAAGIAVTLIAVLGVLALCNMALAWISTPFAAALGGPLSLERVLGWLFTPLAWLLGIESPDVAVSARLLGQRLVATEIVAFQELGRLAAAGAVSPRSMVICSYALCGFAHFASVAIFVGGISALAPERREDLAALSFKALASATLATLMTGALAGVFYVGQAAVLGLP